MAAATVVYAVTFVDRRAGELALFSILAATRPAAALEVWWDARRSRRSRKS